jgi:radical SAM superfamily enzyme YgiQ (UPF0313 family)
MQKKNDILLIFPPVWIADLPFLSTPTLLAFLKENNIDAEQIDLNVEFWKYLYAHTFVCDIYENLKDKFHKIEQQTHKTEQDILMLKKIAIFAQMPLDQFVYEIQKKIILQKIYIELIGIFSDFKNSENNSENNYHDILFSKISLSNYVTSVEKIKKIIHSEQNPYKSFFTPLIDIILNKTKNLVGISITAINQVVSAFTLAYMIKKNNPDCKIVIGGSWCSLLGKELGNKLNDFPFIDYIIVNEGEIPLLNLVNTLKNKKGQQSVKGVYCKIHGQIIYTPNIGSIPLSQVPAGDFSGLEMNFYSEKHTLPIQSSRGCYWGKCTFCSYPILEPKYKTKNVEFILEEVKFLQKKYETKTFCFVDSVVSPSFAEKFSNLIIKNNIKIEWMIFARFEPDFSETLLSQMKESGCITIFWGLESANQRILEIINKNIDLTNAEIILRNATKLKIHNKVLVMYGLPTEKYDDAYETILFIKKNKNYIQSLSYSFYAPEENTPMEYFCKKHKIKLAKKPEDNLIFSYLWSGNMEKDLINKISNEYMKLDHYINNNIYTESMDHFFFHNEKKDLIKYDLALNTTKIRIVSYIVEKANQSERIFYEIT